MEEAGGHLGTGFLSTPSLLFVLADNGRADVAARILLQTTTPSWISQIERGATTRHGRGTTGRVSRATATTTMPTAL
ncbi:hypothetical protein [Curtobacterium sp. ME-Dv--P-122a]|uniref:alpha-L-rhamnosidase-related protein n=1 Tax=Curtobacterium sp. ME-Dv--P-122a TaxID=3040286 RepID=UPI0033071C9C